MEKKNAWEKYHRERRETKYFSSQRSIVSLSPRARRSVSVPQVCMRRQKKQVFRYDELIASGASVKAGDKIVANNMGKGLALFVMGEKGLQDGMNILGAHIDSPRLDLKQVPLYEDTQMAMLDTHYYGGVKKYQW